MSAESEAVAPSPLVNPSIALMVLVVGLIGVFIEFSNPGLIVPDVDGGILVIGGLMALSLLPINFAGVALLLPATVFFGVEAMTPVNGILASARARSLLGKNTHTLP